MRLVNESAKQFELKSNEVKRLLKEKQERLKSLEKSLRVYMVCLQLMNSRERSLEDRERRILELEREIGQLREDTRRSDSAWSLLAFSSSADLSEVDIEEI